MPALPATSPRPCTIVVTTVKSSSVGDEGLSSVRLRAYTSADEDAAVELWRRSWQQAYPNIDFMVRLEWWRQRWHNELVPACTILMAEQGKQGALPVGFVTVDRVGYLDQIVVAPEAWGSPVATVLLDAAKEVAPTGLDLLVNQDNDRAVRFYKKHGFTISGEDVNSRSGATLYGMSWRPQAKE
jgi:putative acetyltransferase